MHTENSIQRVSVRCDDTGTFRELLSIEAYHKLNRASAMTHFVGLDFKQPELTGLHQLSVPHIRSYLHEDISYVMEELKAKGLCRDFVAPPSVSGGEQHV